MVKRFLIWVSTVICDKTGDISHKRVGFFMCLWLLNRAMTMPGVNEILIWAIVCLTFGLAGLSIPEWFSTIKKSEK